MVARAGGMRQKVMEAKPRPLRAGRFRWTGELTYVLWCTQQMIDTYGEIIFKLSLNKQSRRGDAVRELNFEEIEKQRETTGLTDDEIAARIGLLPEQVGVVRVFVERKYHRIDLHRRLFHLGGGKRWKADEYQHPAERLKLGEKHGVKRGSYF